MAKHFNFMAFVCLIVLAAAWAMPGCQRAEEPVTARAPAPETPEPGALPVAEPPASEEEVQVLTPEVRESDKEASPTEAAPPAPETELAKPVPIKIELPAPAFRGTPVPIDEPNVEKPLGKPREPFLAPPGTVNLARGKPVRCSDPAPSAGEVDLVTDGDKEASDFGYLELRPGSQWVQIDLGRKATVYAVLLWHNHADARVYRDVIVQISDDPDFLEAETAFNNDYDQSSGLGLGRHMGYVETSEGKLIDCKGMEGRYVRLYSKGSHIDEKNHYTEVEIFGKSSA
jgi:hypothetical protein